MRSLVVCNIVSLDGYYAAPDGNPLVLEMDHGFDVTNLERIRKADIVLLGRTSFEGFSGYWPHVADAPPDAGDRALDETNREISRIYNRLPKVVASDRYVVPEDNPWRATTTVLAPSEVAQWLEEQRPAGDGDILVFGSRATWNALLLQGLVDQLHLVVSPRALAEGVPLFDGPTELDLLGVDTFDGSGNVLLRYAPMSRRSHL